MENVTKKEIKDMIKNGCPWICNAVFANGGSVEQQERQAYWNQVWNVFVDAQHIIDGSETIPEKIEIINNEMIEAGLKNEK